MSDLRVEAGTVLIGGRWERTNAHLRAEDPSDGSDLGQIGRGGAVEIDAAVAAARDAAPGWDRAGPGARARVLARIAALVRDHATALARMESRDTGKPLGQARADVETLARFLEFYGQGARHVTGDTLPYEPGYSVMTLREPHGVTGHIIPWNFPLQIIGRSVGAALAMGNACVLKPAEQASLSSLAFARLALDAGLPPGALNVVTGLGTEAGAALAAHPGIDFLAFTGSVEVGRQVQAAAGRNLVPVSLELGGKSPQIVFGDADLDAALPRLVAPAIRNAGQTCTAPSRILVERAIYERVRDAMAATYRDLVAGPALSDPDLGPLISARQKARVDGFLDLARPDQIVARGRVGADAPAGGHYVAPTLMAGIAPDHPLAQQEIFGPVQVLIAFEGEDEATRIANGTPYGLVAGVWTENGARQARMARALRAGQVFINNYGAGSGVELPFGGVGQSGHGREKGLAALHGFSRLKTVATYHG